MFPSIDDLMKAQAEAFRTSNSVATTAFDGARKLLELNVQAARAGLEESNAQLKALPDDTLSRLKTAYLDRGGQRDNAVGGWVRADA